MAKQKLVFSPCKNCGKEIKVTSRNKGYCRSCIQLTDSCPVCGEIKPIHLKFCSRSCSAKSMHKDPKYVNPWAKPNIIYNLHKLKNKKVVCKCCGKEFKAKQSNIKWCDDCLNSVDRCPICGKDKPKTRETCSYSCTLQLPKYELTCSNCGEIFYSGVRNRSICSKCKNSKNPCPICGKEKSVLLETCSQSCASKFRWQSEEYRIKCIENSLKTGLKLYGATNHIQATAPEWYKQLVVDETFAKKFFSEVVTTRSQAYAYDSQRGRYLIGMAEKYGICLENDTKTSGEIQIESFLKENNLIFLQKDRKMIAPLELDFYLPEHKLAIEFNGDYWHSSKTDSKYDKNYHYNKTKKCEEAGIRLIHIYEHEWFNPIKQQILKSLIKIACNILEKKIFARNCTINKVSWKDYKEFCEKNHLQGYRYSSVILGLYNEGVLEQLMSFSKPQKRGAKINYEWEIVRGCPGSNCIVVGGLSKLFKYFIDEYDPKSIMSYCDINKFDGTGYLKLNMKLIKETPANRWLVDKKSGKITSWIFRDKERREEQLKNSFEFYGAGIRTYLWEKANEDKNQEA